MSCIQVPKVQLPSIAGGLTIPEFGLPEIDPSVDLCCHFNLFEIPPLNIGGIPILASAFAAINADIATVNAYLAVLDLLAIDCPLD